MLLFAILSGMLYGCGCGGDSEAAKNAEVQPVPQRQAGRGVPENIQKQSSIAGGLNTK